MGEAGTRQSGSGTLQESPPSRIGRDMKGDFDMTTKDPTACPECEGTGQLVIAQDPRPTRKHTYTPCPRCGGTKRKFELIDKRGALGGLFHMRFGFGPDDPQPFILILKPSYVAHTIGKTLPIMPREISEYVEKNAEHLRSIALKAKERSFTTQTLE
jgi:hypothetical protein